MFTGTSAMQLPAYLSRRLRSVLKSSLSLGSWARMYAGRNVTFVILGAIGLLGAWEVGFVQGQIAMLILASGLVTSVVFSAAQENGLDTLEVEGYGLKGRARGTDVLVVLLFFALVGLGYLHHLQEEALLNRVLEAMTENTYVLSLPQADRERLQIQMPDSLRRKIRRD